MKVIALTRTTSIGPSTRYRIEQYRPLLTQRDIQVETRPLFGPNWFALLERPAGVGRTLRKACYSLGRLAVRLGQLWSATRGDADLVHVEQQLFPYLPAWVEFALWPRRKPTLLEFDDAIHLTPGHGRKLAGLCARATVVVVGNRFLAQFARQHAQHVFVIPTTVDTARYDEAHARQQARRAAAAGQAAGDGPDRRLAGAREDANALPGATFRVGWIGLRYNFGFLDVLAQPLAALVRAGQPCELRVISSGVPRGVPWDQLPVVGRPWSTATEAEDIAACDVGVMPLPDTPWARGKCALKVLQYMAAGVPVVASDVGVNADIIQPGANGLLARTPEEWRQALQALADDADLRQRLGEAGRRTVERDFSIEGGARKVAEAYGFASSCADGSGSPPPREPDLLS